MSTEKFHDESYSGGCSINQIAKHDFNAVHLEYI